MTMAAAIVAGAGVLAVPTAAHADTINITTSDDAYVEQAAPDANNGSSTQLRHDSSPVIQTYLKFTVDTSGGTVTGATLRLTPRSNNNTGLSLHSANGAAWNEGSITYNNAPGFNAAIIASSGAVSANVPVDLDVSSVVNADGTYAFAFDSTSPTNTRYSSKEDSAGGAPELIITYTPGGGGPVEADLVVSKSGPSGTIEAGSTVDYQIGVLNNGPANATGVTVVDTLPPSVAYTSATPSQGTCNESGGVITCDLGTVNNGANATVAVTGTAVSVTNSVTVTANETDPNVTDNSDSADITIGPAGTPPPANQVTLAFTGDFGALDSRGGTVLADIVANPDISALFIAGDLSYSEPTNNPPWTEQRWCDFIHGYTGPNFPVEIGIGNHEDFDGPDGDMNAFNACMPDRLNSDLGPGGYGINFAKDFGPATVIMTAADIQYPAGTTYTYGAGTSERTWLDGQVADAQAEGDWVIVANHKNCITMGEKSCEIGEAFLDHLAAIGVDLVMQGHDHTYQRSHAITDFVQNGTGTIADDGSDNTYVRDAGTVLVISGTTGRSLYTCTHTDTEAANFVTHYCGEESTTMHGYSKLTITDTTLTQEFVRTAGPAFSDSFTIQ